MTDSVKLNSALFQPDRRAGQFQPLTGSASRVAMKGRARVKFVAQALAE
jgi:hypothetical protein